MKPPSTTSEGVSPWLPHERRLNPNVSVDSPKPSGLLS